MGRYHPERFLLNLRAHQPRGWAVFLAVPTTAAEADPAVGAPRTLGTAGEPRAERPPAHWLKLAQDAGPPDHWLELVRKEAPELLEPGRVPTLRVAPAWEAELLDGRGN